MTIQSAANNGAFHGFPHLLVSTSNAGGNGVTAGETALWPFPKYDKNGVIIIPAVKPKPVFDLSKCEEALF